MIPAYLLYREKKSISSLSPFLSKNRSFTEYETIYETPSSSFNRTPCVETAGVKASRKVIRKPRTFCFRFPRVDRRVPTASVGP